MVAGIHCRGEDFFLLVFFSPRRLFILVVRMPCISVDFTSVRSSFSSCGLLLIIKKSAGIALFAFNRFVVECKVKERTTVR